MHRHRPLSAPAVRSPGADDLAKLGAVLRLRGGENPVCVAMLRFLRLTGCRPEEIHCLRWSEVKSDRLTLIDAKTGPRHVLLGSATRELGAVDNLAVPFRGTGCSPGENGNEPLTRHAL